MHTRNVSTIGTHLPHHCVVPATANGIQPWRGAARCSGSAGVLHGGTACTGDQPLVDCDTEPAPVSPPQS